MPRRARLAVSAASAASPPSVLPRRSASSDERPLHFLASRSRMAWSSARARSAASRAPARSAPPRCRLSAACSSAICPLERVALLDQRAHAPDRRWPSRPSATAAAPENCVAASLPSPPSSSVACSVQDVPALLVGRLDLGFGVVERLEDRDPAVAVAIGGVAVRAPRRRSSANRARCARRRSWSR